MQKPNELIHESSPYLLQHAYNPVNWRPWNEQVFADAEKQDKLILFSIGYSACHWCHVMEHESFEDGEVAEIMNQFFICVKIDREERPDLDQIYMSAVQLMTGRGGWPLNCFALPDGRPVYGGTYIPKQQWKNILLNLADLYKKDKGRLKDYADELTTGVIKSGKLIPNTEERIFEKSVLEDAVFNWSKSFDNVNGGPDRAPKFPLPNNYSFLLQYAFQNRQPDVLEHVKLTLQKMAFGGIYDQLGGGFARYSVDGIWKVPHFEKMLYDNAQLVSLYASAFKLEQNELYKEVVYETIEFVKNELSGANGNFYSALDADSEGVEGKYYVWNIPELKEVLSDEYKIFAAYYNVRESTEWEHGNYILMRAESDEKFAANHSMTTERWKQRLSLMKKKLLAARIERIKPGLDDKTLSSWNGLMSTALFDAYDAFQDPGFLQLAERNRGFLKSKMIRENGQLFRNFKNDKSTINAFLDDYAFVIQAFIRGYQCTFNIQYLNDAKLLMNYVLKHFNDDESPMFFYTSVEDKGLIVRMTEVQDNVIASSNSQMAINLFQLGTYFEESSWIERSKNMLHQMQDKIFTYPSAYSNWMLHICNFVFPFREVVFTGSDTLKFRESISHLFLPGTLFCGAVSEENLPLLKNRIQNNHSLIYVCENQSCLLPVSSANEAIEILR